MTGEPVLGVSRLVVVGTGSATATSLPAWLDWLRQACPDLTTTVVLTRGALRFVTRQAIEPRITGEFLLDTWPEEDTRARHVELTEWAQAFLVYPATLHFLARLALGLADSPALLAAQCATVPIALAPALPPGGADSPAFAAHWSTLAQRRNVVLAPPVPGRSLTTGRVDAAVPPPLPEVLALLERRRTDLDADARRLADQPPEPAAFLADRERLDRETR